ncbi:MAG: BatA and WFA domain-containing protein [Planctomycetota bacterium]
MTFASPLLAAVAAAVAIPALVILYFLKLRRRDVEISSTLLWKKTIRDMQANAPFQKLRRNLLLFLQMIALLLGLLALAQPELAAEAVAGSRHTIMIDRSASMAATDGDINGRSVTRLEQAISEAIDLIDALAEPTWIERALDSTAVGDQATVIAFDAAGEIVQTMTDDKSLLRAAVASIEITDGSTAAAQAYRLGVAQAPPNTRIDRDGREIALPPAVGRVHLWSDGRIADAQDVTPGPEDAVTFNLVGFPDAGNIGITGLRTERAFDDPTELSVFVGLASTLDAPATVDVELVIDGVLEGVREAEITAAEGPALGAGGVVFSLDRASGAVAEVRVRPPAGASDLLAVDNSGWLAVPPARRLRVAIVSEDDFFTSLAIEGLPLDRFTRLTPVQYDQAARSETLAEYDVVILDGWLPDDGSIAPGSSLILGAVPEVFGLTSTGTTGTTGTDELIDWSPTHPATRELELTGRVTIAGAPRIEIGPDASVDVLAEAGAGPMIFDAATADARAIIVGFDPDRSSWPFDVSYVVFLAAALDTLGGVGGAEDAALSVAPGTTHAERLPAGVRDVRLIIPDAPDQPLTPADDGRVAFGPLRRTGAYALEWNGPAGARDLVAEDGVNRRIVAVNLLDPDESDLRADDALTFASGEVRADEARSSSAPLRLWRWALLAALLVMLFEWWIYNRRVYI